MLLFLLGQGIECLHGAVEELQVGGGAHAFEAFADVGVQLLALRCGEDVLRESAAQRLGEVEVHEVAAQGVGARFPRS